MAVVPLTSHVDEFLIEYIYLIECYDKKTNLFFKKLTNNDKH